jgi:nicotinate-nucleotide adenylyltransferase
VVVRAYGLRECAVTIGLFGGSFDPIHHGHLLVAQAVLEALQLEEVRFVPAREQPFKAGRHTASPEDRARMVALAIRDEPRFALERVEIDRPGPSYTVDTLRELRRREPGKEFAILVGADAARELTAWREADQLPQLSHIIVFDRPGAEVPPLPWPIQAVRAPVVDIAATEIRKRVATGRSIRYWVPDAVAEFIIAKGLYFTDA